MDTAEILAQLKSHAKPGAVDGMAKFGIRPTSQVYGVSIPTIRTLARQINKANHGKNQPLAEQLWASGVHEARIMAGLIADPEFMDSAALNRWAGGFDSWDVCDQVCNNLFVKSALAYKKVIEWAPRQEEFVRRAAFALIASLAIQDKSAPDVSFERLLPLIVAASTDERNFVKKAVNWALRGIGKRDAALCAKAIETATAIQQLDSKAARWIASDTLRELRSDTIQTRLKARKPGK